LSPEDFAQLLDSVQENLERMGREIFAGNVAVSPFRKGAMKACDYCISQAVCRVDPWGQPFRVLKLPQEEAAPR
jgi:ATP-dependent helicase/nuclease subunit B